jgi:glycosyltransferase involved in cell wall biosynthesis
MHWSLLIATYNRPNALRYCLQCAVAQSRPPSEIVIVDSSDTWQAHRLMALEDVASRASSGINWRYERAQVRGLTSQRNQAIALASGDVLFLIDDDSFMYPNCAEEIMKIYEADVSQRVAGVAPVETTLRPDSASTLGSVKGARIGRAISRVLGRLRSMLEQELDVTRLLLPYDPSYPDHPIPPEIIGGAVVRTRYFNGFRMTFRAPVIRGVGFDETLKRYASAEDLDASYRASRHGVLLNAINAFVFHAQDESARLSRHTRTLLGLLNLAYLYRCTGYDPARLLGAYRWLILRRLLVDVLRDLSRRRLSLPCARADIEALIRLTEIGHIPSETINEWYAALQEDIIARNAA